MALASGTYTVAVSSSDATATGSKTASYTMPTGTDLGLVVIIGVQSKFATVDTVSLVKYDSVDMEPEFVSELGDSSRLRLAAYSLIAPSTGANDIAYTLDGAGNITSHFVIAVPFTGANQTDMIGSSATNEAASGSDNVTLDLLTTTAGSLVVGAIQAFGADVEPFTAATSVTEKVDGDTGLNASDDCSYFAGEMDAASVATYTFGADGSVNDGYSVIAFEVLEAAAGGGGATDVTPTAATVALTGESPTVALIFGLAPTAGALALSGESPGVAVEAPATDVTPTAGTAALTGESPSVALKRALSATAGTLSLSGESPTVALKYALSPSAGALNLAGESPSLLVSSAKNVQPTAATLALTGESPAIALRINVSPTAAALALAGESPAVAVIEAGNVDVNVGTLALTGASPTIALKYNVAPVAGTLSLSGESPAVFAGIPSVAKSTREGAGGGRRRRTQWRKRKVVIDGVVHEVRSPMELARLLEHHEEVLRERLSATEAPKARTSIKRQISVTHKKVAAAREEVREYVRDDVVADDEEVLVLWASRR